MDLKQLTRNLDNWIQDSGYHCLHYGVWREGDDAPRFRHFHTPGERRNVYSVSKTFTACAVGMAIGDGKLSLEDKLIDFFPVYAELASERHKQVTIRNLLQMQSGKLDYLFHRAKRSTEKSWSKLFFKEELRAEPGTEYYYANLNSYMLGRVIEKLYGENLLVFLTSRLFTPLGIEHPQWNVCSRGYSKAFTELYLSIEHLMAFARLLLQNGKYDGKQLVPADFIEKMASDLVPTDNLDVADPQNEAGYGYHIWKSTHGKSWRADGLYGQFVLIYPEERLAVVIQSMEDKKTYDIIRAVDREIVTKL